MSSWLGWFDFGLRYVLFFFFVVVIFYHHVLGRVLLFGIQQFIFLSVQTDRDLEERFRQLELRSKEEHNEDTEELLDVENFQYSCSLHSHSPQLARGEFQLRPRGKAEILVEYVIKTDNALIVLLKQSLPAISVGTIHVLCVLHSCFVSSVLC